MKFSVAIPAYKSKYLKEALESCLSQTYADYEVVVVDDASPENLREIVSGFNDARLHYYRNEKNCGAIDVVDNWNICLAHCNGEYVICMGDDDKLTPNSLSGYAELINKYPGLDVYHAWTEIIDESSQFKNLQQPRPEYESGLSVIWNRWNGRDKQYIGDFCFNRAELKRLGGFIKLPLAWFSDDITVAMMAIQKGIANTQTICFQYRENSMTLTNSGRTDIKLAATKLAKQWYGELFSKLERSKETLPAIDQKYLTLLRQQLPVYYRERLVKWLRQDLNNHLLHSFYWCVHRKKYDLTLKMIFSGVFNAVKKRMRRA